jgi:predicted amidohydrolase YtcJ
MRADRLSRRRFLAAGIAAALAPGAFAAAAGGRLVLHGGRIYTGRTGQAPVEALAIDGGRVVLAGSAAAARRRVPGAREFDLRGATAFPGFVDSHAHFLGIGLRELTLNLEGTGSATELTSRLKAFADAHPGGPVFGRGWIETHWPEHRFPTRADLDTVVSDRPVWLERADGHAGVANGAALALAGIDAHTADPPGGRILRDPSGQATGMLVDAAMALVASKMPTPDTATRRKALALADDLYLRRGWTGVHAMSVEPEEIDLLVERSAAGTQRLRVDGYLDASAISRVQGRGPWAAPGGKVRVRGMKYYADGALGSRGAALLAPYSDAPDTTGLVQMTDAEALAAFARARDAGLQVAVHAIGDRGNRLALNWIEQTLGAASGQRRWRIEHAQVISPADLPRFAKMGVIASMQPSHAIGDLYFAPARLGPERLKGAYAWRSLLASGAVVCAGSDAPVEKGDPRIEFYAATYRHALDGFAGPDWGLDEAVSREQALAMLTSQAAFAIGREHELGTLEPGKLADVTVFSKDLMRVAPPEILTAEPVATIIGGEVAWDAARGG